MGKHRKETLVPANTKIDDIVVKLDDHLKKALKSVTVDTEQDDDETRETELSK